MPHTPTPPSPPADTRQRLIETAARLFHEQGYSATGISTILREADVHAGSLYHFFPTKEALLEGVLDRYRLGVEPIVMQPIEKKEADPVERVFALLAWYRDGMSITGCRMGCPVGNLALELADNHPEVRRLTDACFRGWCAGVERWLRSAADRFPPGTDFAAISQTVLNIMEGAIMQARSRGDLSPFDTSVQQLRVYIDLLLAEGKRTQTAGGSRVAAAGKSTPTPISKHRS